MINYILTLLTSSLILTLLPAALQAQAQNGSLEGFRTDRAEWQLEAEQMLIRKNTPEKYREHLYRLTQRPHIAGTAGSRDVIEYMSRVMEEAGLKVDHYDYDAWMPKPGNVSVSIVRPIRMPLNNQEYILDEDPYTDHPELVHGWNAYSGSGEASGEIVYANFGTREDFMRLKELGIDVTGKIVIARYGGNFRGYKAKFAEEAGAAGLIIYTDPENGGYMSGLTYPEGRHSSESTIQRGSLLTLDYYGDPLTPFEPALPLDNDDTPQRLDSQDVAFHTIPVAPIGYGAAKEIFSRMEGPAVPSGWQGGLPYTYRLTGGPELTVNVSVDQPKEYTRITNVTGTVTGSEYPDQWIILGSHHDAWGFGATDPNSGTAMLLTLAESLGELVNNGYRPKRSIMIAHWDAEEFMLIGSSEWVEELKQELHENAILYLNADMSVTGPNFRASSSPSLKKAIMEASKAVPHPDTDSTVYESWIRPQQDEPGIGNLGGGSDHVGLYMHAGVPSAGLSISGNVPIYHSNYDSFHFYESFIDSTFQYGPTLAGVYGVTALRFANAGILPYDLNRYASDMSGHVESILNRAEELDRAVETAELRDELSRVEAAAREIENGMKVFLDSGPGKELLEQINREMISLERSFLEEEGLPFSRWQQSLYSSTDPWSGYASWMLPGIRYTLEDSRSDEELNREVDRFRNAVSRLAEKLETIADMMN
ncbi:M28 family peptidase [Rhodohalobacter mucosus]|uniref:Glutamate carboxypeptidase n=1 Tax=Rhodohalobacter mucosus TaxID=2079485 RepID=A0A316TU68_9BACT|nr:M28 family peptidase [Rhodohalobacter mucosus]PWN07970.1 glutamate carboxypeptidase [Rhodohalobacter mucosus]